jgi:hypothetical protein
MQRFKSVCTPQSPETDHAVPCEAHVYESPHQAGFSPEKGGQCILPASARP